MGNSNSIKKMLCTIAPFRKNQEKYFDLLEKRDLSTNYLLNMKQSIVPELNLKLLAMSIDKSKINLDTNLTELDLYNIAEIQLDEDSKKKNFGKFDLYFCEKTKTYWKIKSGTSIISLYKEVLNSLKKD